MRALVVLAALCGVFALPSTSSANGGSCNGFYSSSCSASVAAGGQQFHGLIALSDDSNLLDRSAHLGTQPGCGDCTWELVLACTSAHSDPGTNACTQAVDAPNCAKDQLAYTLYLSTATTAYENEGLVCIGGAEQIVPVGMEATASVESYLKDITPPELGVAFDPRNPIAGFPTKAEATVPELKSHGFGGGGVEETITIAPKQISWNWGDGGTAIGRKQLHTFSTRGGVTTTLTTTWGATYTVGYQGLTLGPYNATGTLTRTQRSRLTVGTSTPVLVSHA